jgi:uncharacterized cupin superfamily protein
MRQEQSICGAIAIALAFSLNASGEVPGSQPTLTTVGAMDVAARLSSPEAVKKSTSIRTTTMAPVFQSTDRHFVSAIFSSTAGHVEFESYPADEFCYILEGDMVFTGKDNAVTRLEKGDVVVIPKGWSGGMTTKGYTKFFVSYKEK